jgi:alpha-tubulin suppressor-like RCC1 family protein
MAVISQDGQLFVAGSNSHGKLGIDLPKTQTVKIPTPVPTLSNQQIQQVSCGADYTLALSLSGLVYAWG